MTIKKIKKGDLVIAIAGRDKGKQGTVLQVSDDKVLVEGINLIKKHQKPNPQANIKGGIIQKEVFMDLSNVAIYNELTKKADKVGFKVIDGRKVRFYKSNGEVIDI